MNVSLAFATITRRTIRLIATAHHKPPVLERLAASFGARSRLEALEAVTSGRMRAQQQGLPGIAPTDLASAYGQTYINAAFAYPRPKGNRFNPDRWCAWYSAFEVETGLAEVAFHLTRALEATGGYYDNTTQYLELHATFDAEFCDLRGVTPVPTCLHPDTAVGYPEGQALAEVLRAAGRNGIVYPSVRLAGGTCLVAFWPHLVQAFQQGEVWTLRWAGDPTPVVMKGAHPP